MEHYVTLSIFRTIVSYFILMVVTYHLGKQVNAHKNHNNFAISITLGSFIANMGFDTNLKFFPMLAAFLTLVILYFIMSAVSSNSRRFRKWLSGQPTVIIENGKLLDSNMKKVKYTLDHLNLQLREQGIFDIVEVEYALLEVSGNLSVLKKSAYQPVTKKDLNLAQPNQKNSLPVELIMDGVVIDKNLNASYSRQWLGKELDHRGVEIKDIHYAVVGTNGSFFIDLYQDHLKSPVDKE
ncbi:DUF421 domain-containing protein [Neobacillus niacini]|uniref:DUF421 domain-containing protein n=1 Tax=Neobacillus niacini TaxID=86668 RepID=UPI002861B816|nr:DUF421 domain-containing protein [Neobacillus niacini]MDR6998890.1 uncharacterized membrane protein YcaP (DUF421 family) [Neobacillus niacini]